MANWLDKARYGYDTYERFIKQIGQKLISRRLVVITLYDTRNRLYCHYRLVVDNGEVKIQVLGGSAVYGSTAFKSWSERVISRIKGEYYNAP
jgi:hypothetical protein